MFVFEGSICTECLSKGNCLSNGFPHGLRRAVEGEQLGKWVLISSWPKSRRESGQPGQIGATPHEIRLDNSLYVDIVISMDTPLSLSHRNQGLLVERATLVGDIVQLVHGKLLLKAEIDDVCDLVAAVDTSIRLVDSGLRQNATGQVGRRCPAYGHPCALKEFLIAGLKAAEDWPIGARGRGSLRDLFIQRTIKKPNCLSDYPASSR